MAKELPRKNYSISNQNAVLLSRTAIDIGEKIGLNVKRQEVLDVLVSLLKDKDICKIVFGKIQKNG